MATGVKQAVIYVQGMDSDVQSMFFQSNLSTEAKIESINSIGYLNASKENY